MIATVKRLIASAIAKAHNLFAKSPLSLQFAFKVIVAGLVTLAVGFGWHIPTSVNDASWMFGAFVAAAYAYLVPQFTTLVLPNLTSWLIWLLGIVTEISPTPIIASAEQSVALRPVVVLWRVAA